MALMLTQAAAKGDDTIIAVKTRQRNVKIFKE